MGRRTLYKHVGDITVHMHQVRFNQLYVERERLMIGTLWLSLPKGTHSCSPKINRILLSAAPPERSSRRILIRRALWTTYACALDAQASGGTR